MRMTWSNLWLRSELVDKTVMVFCGSFKPFISLALSIECTSMLCGSFEVFVQKTVRYDCYFS